MESFYEFFEGTKSQAYFGGGVEIVEPSFIDSNNNQYTNQKRQPKFAQLSLELPLDSYMYEIKQTKDQTPPIAWKHSQCA